MPQQKRPAFNTRFEYAHGHKRDGTSVLIINEHFKASSDLLVMCSGSDSADFPGASGNLARDLCNAIVPDEDQDTLSDAARSEEAINMAQKVVLRGVQELDTQNLLTGINTSLLALRLHSEGGEMFVDSYEIGGIRWALLQLRSTNEYSVTYFTPAENSEHAKSRLNKLNLVASHMKSQGYVLECQRLTPKSLVVAGTGLCVRACVIDLVIFVCASVCVCMRVL